jgi:hypothetical protein
MVHFYQSYRAAETSGLAVYIVKLLSAGEYKVRQ